MSKKLCYFCKNEANFVEFGTKQQVNWYNPNTHLEFDIILKKNIENKELKISEMNKSKEKDQEKYFCNKNCQLNYYNINNQFKTKSKKKKTNEPELSRNNYKSSINNPEPELKKNNEKVNEFKNKPELSANNSNLLNTSEEDNKEVNESEPPEILVPEKILNIYNNMLKTQNAYKYILKKYKIDVDQKCLENDERCESYSDINRLINTDINNVKKLIEAKENTYLLGIKSAQEWYMNMLYKLNNEKFIEFIINIKVDKDESLKKNKYYILLFLKRGTVNIVDLFEPFPDSPPTDEKSMDYIYIY